MGDLKGVKPNNLGHSYYMSNSAKSQIEIGGINPTHSENNESSALLGPRRLYIKD
jgi:hypothetical protein